jgi:hypothetical protein
MDVKKALIFSLESMGRICQARQEPTQARNYFKQAYDVAQTIDLKHAMQKIASEMQ